MPSRTSWCALDRRAHRDALRCRRLSGSSSGRPSGPMPVAQVSFFTKGVAAATRRWFDPARRRSRCDSRGAAACAAGRATARPPARRLLRVPVLQIVRRVLKVPLQLAGRGVKRQHRVRVQVVALPLPPVVVGARVAGGPVQRVKIGVVGAGEPRGRAAVLDVLAAPGLGARFAGAAAWSRSARLPCPSPDRTRPGILARLRRRPRCRTRLALPTASGAEVAP